MPTTKDPPWLQGNAPAYACSKWKTRTMWLRNKSAIWFTGRGGAHTPHNVGSTLVMELIDKNFPFSALAGLKTIPGLLPAPYHQIKIITPNINKFEKVDFSWAQKIVVNKVTGPRTADASENNHKQDTTTQAQTRLIGLEVELYVGCRIHMIGSSTRIVRQG